MKPTTTLTALFLATTLNAQVTIDFSDLSASGVPLDMYILTAPGAATEPSDGINQIRDLTSVTLPPGHPGLHGRIDHPLRRQLPHSELGMGADRDRTGYGPHLP